MPKPVTKRMQKRLGKGWRKVVDEGEKQMAKVDWRQGKHEYFVKLEYPIIADNEEEAIAKFKVFLKEITEQEFDDNIAIEQIDK